MLYSLIDPKDHPLFKPLDAWLEDQGFILLECALVDPHKNISLYIPNPLWRRIYQEQNLFEKDPIFKLLKYAPHKKYVLWQNMGSLHMFFEKRRTVFGVPEGIAIYLRGGLGKQVALFNLGIRSGIKEGLVQRGCDWLEGPLRQQAQIHLSLHRLLKDLLKTAEPKEQARCALF